MGSWSEDKLKALRQQYNFEKRNCPNHTPDVPSECELDSRGVLQWKGGKRPVVHSGRYNLPPRSAKDTVRTYDRARLHRALDAVMDATPDGNFSPDEDDRMKALVAEAQKVVRKWKADREKLCVKCYEIGGNFRGSGYWKRIREIIKVGLE